MAAKKNRPAGDPPAGPPGQREIEAETTDRDERIARVAAETSSDGRFSTYEVAPKRDPRDGDLIVQYRGAPRED